MEPTLQITVRRYVVIIQYNAINKGQHMNYHVVTDEYWMKEKDAIVETLSEYCNNITQPISQREFFIRSLKRRIHNNRMAIHELSWFERFWSKRNKHRDLADEIAYDLCTVARVKHEIQEVYNHMYCISIKMQHHYFDLVGVGYGDKESRLTEEDIAALDARWLAAHPDEEDDNV